MSDVVAWGSALGVLVALITLAKFWMDMGATKRDASEAIKKAETMAAELSAFKTNVAEKYPSMQMLAASEGRLAQAIDAMRGDFSRAMSELTARFDRFFAAAHGP